MPTATKTYAFSQLRNKKSKARACDWYRDEYHDQLFDQHGCEHLTDIFKEDLENHYHLGAGFEVYWSLSCCQGDGVAFQGDVNVGLLRQNDPVFDQLFKTAMVTLEMMEWDESAEDACDMSITIKDDGHHYHHWNTMSIEVEPTAWPDTDYGNMPREVEAVLEQLGDSVRGYISERVKEISREMEKSGYSEIEYHSSDEYISELLANDDSYEFTWQGEHIED